jgi:cytochrome b
VPKRIETGEVEVWDPFVRVAHWLLVVGFVIAYLTEDDMLPVHVWAGYVIGALVVARVLWGFVGPRQARFSDFVYPPRVVVSYLADLIRFQAPRYLGHSPAGGAMVIVLWLGLAGTVGTGLAVYGAEEGAGPLRGLYTNAASSGGSFAALANGDDERRRGTERGEGRKPEGTSDILEEAHEFLANLTLLLVVLHVAGVMWASLVHGENLAKSMITGRKRAAAGIEGAGGTAPQARTR